MGYIHNDIKTHFLPKYPEQEKILKPLINGFDITYADKRDLNNTTLYTYILKPEDQIKSAFGIEKEMLMVYTPYEEFQPRAIQATNLLFSQFPFQNRVDTLNCFVISHDEAVYNYRGINQFGEEQSRSIIPILYSDIVSNGKEGWYIRNLLRENCYDVDLFGYTLPLRDESSFFGRQQIISRYIDSIKRCENRGIFGVRKTGKTSLLFKLDRIIREQHLGFVFYYDCKSPSYRKLHWNQFLGSICDNIAKRLGVKIRPWYDEKDIIKSFRYVMKIASERNKKIIIMFDEIEYISFNSQLDPHWKTEFIDFWQTFWSVQSLHRNLVFILSGVNASVTEIDNIRGVQNPLFGIVQSEYLMGLSNEDSHDMIRTVGRRMGLNFDYDAIECLCQQYNGHPMLLRLACSYINRQFESSKRPVKISLDTINSMQEEIDIDLAYYFKHVVSEIQQFYPDEYEMFELLASGQTSDFVELATISEYTKHLYSYGLIANDNYKRPYVRMPVAGRYVAMELAKKEGRRSIYKLIEKEKRNEWIRQRVSSIIRDLRQLESAIRVAHTPKLFGENSFPEAEKFIAVPVIEGAAEFSTFFNICNKCFVEAIENYGTSIGKSKYFWEDIKNSYPALFNVLHRIKVYRNFEDHLQLNDTTAKNYKAFFAEDTNGIEGHNDKLFCIQQKLLESFLTSIQIEISNIS